MEEGQSLDVLHPDAIVNIKRELARKGIIRNYEDMGILEQPSGSATEGGETETNQINELSEAPNDMTTEQTDSFENDDDEVR